MRSLRIKGLAAIAAAVATVGALALSALPASARSNDASQVAAALDKIAVTGRMANVIPSQTDAGFAALTAVASIPFDPMVGVSVKTSDGQKITIGLPDAEHLSKGIKTTSGVVIYRNSNGSDAVAVPTAQGVQFLTVIENSSAPTNYAYPTTTPQGGKIQLTADGGALVLDNHGVPVSSVAAPWALGGNNAVQTWFSSTAAHSPSTSPTRSPGCGTQWWRTHTSATTPYTGADTRLAIASFCIWTASKRQMWPEWERASPRHCWQGPVSQHGSRRSLEA